MGLLPIISAVKKSTKEDLTNAFELVDEQLWIIRVHNNALKNLKSTESSIDAARAALDFAGIGIENF
ncbi:hypothetical protein NECAME_11531 [Necator americanus]|uniref:Uncharacterized protein n=1 Tax=Necator americanus TaxID=51031 RepID=W2T4W6_NECAM|nr:hypothetical protein NECAME_11531 [Necator americanus]ETN76629.1 hypothetical protein NECAME_11531 [Necator americanus]